MSSLSATRLRVNPMTATEKRLYRLVLAERIAAYERRPRLICFTDCKRRRPARKPHNRAS